MLNLHSKAIYNKSIYKYINKLKLSTNINSISTSTTQPIISSSSTSPTDPIQLSSETTHFGYQTILKSNKEKLVSNVFHNVANSYDIMNDFMSVGIHRMWKEIFINKLNPTSNMKHLDVAGGTGDIAFRSIEAFRHNIANTPITSYPLSKTVQGIDVTVCDINPSMLAVGKQRAIERGYYPGDKNDFLIKHKLEFIEGNAEKLPFESDSMDAYTIAFGLRNVTNTDQALKEAHRVLKRGGRFMCLEFSQVPNPLLRQFYDMYSFNVIPLLGEMVAKDRPSYQYLVESIRKFPAQEELLSKMNAAGFQCTSYENLTFGIVAIHSGYKL